MRTTEIRDALLDNVRSYVTHDVRNPLAAVWTSVALLTELDDGSDPLKARSLATITSGLNRTLRKLDVVGLLLEIESGRRALERRELVTDDLLVGLRDRIAGIDPRRDVELQSQVGQVAADRELVIAALAALVDNAVLHGGGPEGVRVIIENGPGDLTTIFAVEDKGSGPQNQDALFLPMGESGRRGKGAVGAGLALVRLVAELHRGGWGFGNLPARGSRFEFEIPT